MRALKILIVDDNADAAETTATLFEMLGHVPRVAYDGLEALEVAQAFSPEVIFLDIGLPGMDGYEVARRLRQAPGYCSLALVALTGWGGQEDLDRARDAGFDRHLTKPVTMATFEALLSGLSSSGPDPA